MVHALLNQCKICTRAWQVFQKSTAHVSCNTNVENMELVPSYQPALRRNSYLLRDVYSKAQLEILVATVHDQGLAPMQMGI